MSGGPVKSPVESLRNTRRSIGDGTLGGRSRIATPYRPDRLRNAVRAVSSSSVIPQGELLAISGTAVTVAGGGSTLASLAETIQAQSGFTSVDSAGDVPTLPLSGSYVAEVDVRWTDGYRGGGTVRVLLAGAGIEEVWPTAHTSEPWCRWVDQVTFAGGLGETFDVEVTPDDGASHTADVTVRLAVVEPLRTIPVAQYDGTTFIEDGVSMSRSLLVAGGGTQTFEVDYNAADIAVGDLMIGVIAAVDHDTSGTVDFVIDPSFNVIGEYGRGTRTAFALVYKYAGSVEANDTTPRPHEIEVTYTGSGDANSSSRGARLSVHMHVLRSSGSSGVTIGNVINTEQSIGYTGVDTGSYTPPIAAENGNYAFALGFTMPIEYDSASWFTWDTISFNRNAIGSDVRDAYSLAGTADLGDLTEWTADADAGVSPLSTPTAATYMAFVGINDPDATLAPA